MIKYINAEKLKAEIERRMSGLYPMVGFEITPIGVSMQLAREELKHLLFFIKSLQQEQPKVDLEKEIKDTCRNYRINDYHEQELGKNDIENIARHFYKLGIKAGKEK